MKKNIIYAVFALAILAGAYYYLANKPGDAWSVAPDGTFSYPQNRGSVQYGEVLLNDTTNFTLSKIIYESKGEKIYALLRVPKNTGRKEIPALVVLPGALVTKEGEQGVADYFRENGYATLTLDERGNSGETKGGASMQDEYVSFINNREPEEHKMVFDALRAFDILRERRGIDKNNIGIYGESMGGRFAIITAALDPRIKYAVGASTSGYDEKAFLYSSPSGQNIVPPQSLVMLYASIDPDSYIGKISPRKVMMIHAARDTTVPVSAAKSTFEYANEPKRFVEVDSACHGLCPDMREELTKELKANLPD